MRILHIVAGKTWGGGETCVLNMCQKLREAGHTIYIVADKSARTVSQRFSRAFSVTLLNLHPLFLPIAGYRLHYFIKKNRIDVVNIHTGKVMLLAVMAVRGTEARLVVFRHNALNSRERAADDNHLFPG